VEDSLVKKIVFLLLIACAAFIAQADKVTIERPENPDIDLIVIEDDTLTVKSRGKNYTFKFSELLEDKSKSVEAKKSDPETLEEAFETNGEWCFFRFQKSGANVLRYLNKNANEAFQEGELLQKVLYKNKYYARDLKKNIYVPHWEVKPDFSVRLMPAEEYIQMLGKQIEQGKENIKKLGKAIPQAEKMIKADRKKFIQFLKANNITETTTDKDGNVIVKETNSATFGSKLTKQLRLYDKDMRTQESKLKSLIQRRSNYRYQVNKLQKLKQNSEELYKRYAVSKTQG
jgi:hypothetical protein